MDILHDKMRIIQEHVPGKQITIAHIIANPDPSLYASIGLKEAGGKPAVGIVTVCPAEAAIIAGDIAIKAAGVKLECADRVTGSLIFTGSVSEIEASLGALTDYAKTKLGFDVCDVTKT
jgi:ethanolamine utilization protein EutS